MQTKTCLFGLFEHWFLGLFEVLPAQLVQSFCLDVCFRLFGFG
jgi:hypothetical protein